MGQKKSSKRSKTETKSRGHNHEEELPRIVVSSGKWNRQVSKTTDWKWVTRFSNFFFLSREDLCFVFRVEVEAKFLNICLILFQVQIRIFLLYLDEYKFSRNRIIYF